ncbi:MAG: hypothetical protein K6U04_07435 [Armatimonadetes bacterium]|nr:hypothetical protein [Armatimonadota bacterium]
MSEINGKNRYGYIYLEDTYAPIPEKPLRPALLRLRGISRPIHRYLKTFHGNINSLQGVLIIF